MHDAVVKHHSQAGSTSVALDEPQKNKMKDAETNRNIDTCFYTSLFSKRS